MRGAAHKSKTVAAFLAAALGIVGAHRLYLGRRYWWVYTLFAVTLIPLFVGFVEAIVFALTPDEKWDARWNAQSDQRSRTRWGPILIAIATLMIGMTIFLSLLALVFQTVFELQAR